MRKQLALVAGLWLLTDSAAAEIINVPADFGSIQAAIDAATDGDEIVVAAGTYPEHLDFLGKTITVRSSGGPDVTALDGQGTGTVVSLESGERNAALTGFTIKKGRSFVAGGGVMVTGSSASITNCVFLFNEAYRGGGLAVEEGGAVAVTNCRFDHQLVTVNGTGAICAIASDVTVTACEFDGGGVDGSETYVYQGDLVVRDTIYRGRGTNIYVHTSALTVLDSRFEGVTYEAIEIADDDSIAVIERSVFLDCGGGAIYAGAGQPAFTLRDCTIRNSDYVLVDSRNLLVERCSFIDNDNGGLRIAFGPGVVRDCLFEGNSGQTGAGALRAAGAFVITDCVFRNNHCGEHGGAVSGGSSTQVLRCDFIGNSADERGGAIWISGGGGSIVSCRFFGNQALDGGAISHGAVANCLVVGNVAANGGGGMFYRSGSSATNTTFAFNQAAFGGGLYTEDASGARWFANCIVSGNVTTEGGHAFDDAWSDLTTVSHSIVQGGWTGAGEGILDLDPAFLDPTGCDGVSGTPDDDLRLSLESAGIDAGSDAFLPPDVHDLDGDGDVREPLSLDLRGADRITDGDADGSAIIDMGAYENRNELPLCCGDVDGSGTVDVTDLLAILAAWGQSGVPEDLDGDGVVAVGDLLLVLAAWGVC